MKNTSILLVDDHQLILELISESLEATNAFSVTCAVSLDQACQKIAEKTNFDIVMLDITLSEAVGLQEVKKIVDLNANGYVVIFSGTVSETFVQNCLDVGVSGFIPKTFSGTSEKPRVLSGLR
jgi:DNA-binding NarL/FixJ family response regulator